MAGPGGGLLSTCALLFAGSYGCGLLPRLVPATPARLAALNAVSGGLLIGAALCVILPEAFEQLHESNEAAGDHALPQWAAGVALLGGFLLMLLLDAAVQGLQTAGDAKRSKSGSGGRNRDGDASGDDEESSRRRGRREVALGALRDTSSKERGGSGGAETLTATSAANAAADGSDAFAPQRPGPAQQRQSQQQQQPARSARGTSVLLGLLVHSAADGLAVGSAALAGTPSVSLTVAAAMLFHKLPVAAGLSAFLSGPAVGWPWPRVNAGMLAFSAAAPVVALASYLLLSHLGGGGGEDGGGPGVALALLLSGGTVLYAAAAHVLPEALAALGGHGHSGGGAHAHSHGWGGEESDGEESAGLLGGGGGGGAAAGAAVAAAVAAAQQRRRAALLWLTVGALVPLLLSAGLGGHDHGHSGGHGGHGHAHDHDL